MVYKFIRVRIGGTIADIRGPIRSLLREPKLGLRRVPFKGSL